MAWLVKVTNPFKDGDEAVSHLVAAVSAEGEREGMPLSEKEKISLAGGNDLPVDFCEKAKKLIGQLLLKEPQNDDEYASSPRSFGNSAWWARKLVDRSEWPNILALAHAIEFEQAYHRPELHGWKWLADKALLWTAGIAVVLLMLGVVVMMGTVFHWK